MYDLIYGGGNYIEDLKIIFPTAIIKDASDEVHEKRVSIEVDMPTDDYLRDIILHGCHDVSLAVQLHPKKDLLKKLEKWHKQYPEYFNNEELK